MASAILPILAYPPALIVSWPPGKKPLRVRLTTSPRDSSRSCSLPAPISLFSSAVRNWRVGSSSARYCWPSASFGCALSPAPAFLLHHGVALARTARGTAENACDRGRHLTLLERLANGFGHLFSFALVGLRGRKHHDEERKQQGHEIGLGHQPAFVIPVLRPPLFLRAIGRLSARFAPGRLGRALPGFRLARLRLRRRLAVPRRLPAWSGSVSGSALRRSPQTPSSISSFSLQPGLGARPDLVAGRQERTGWRSRRRRWWRRTRLRCPCPPPRCSPGSSSPG